LSTHGLLKNLFNHSWQPKNELIKILNQIKID